MSLSLAGDGTLTGVDLDALSASGRLPSGLLPSGSTLQVVQTVKTDTFTTTSTSFVDITGMSVTITPSSATSKVLILANFVYSRGGSGVTRFRLNLVRDSTNIAQPTVGTSIGTLQSNADDSGTNNQAGISFIDSPGTASPVTYKLQVAVNSNTFTFNQEGITSTSVSISTISAIEVAA